MKKILPLFIGLRYTRAKRRNQFISFISIFSLVGMAIGVMALVLVMSVMNGFDREMKQRLLSVVPHGFVDFPEATREWQTTASVIEKQDDVIGTAPYVGGNALISYAEGVEALELQGIDPEREIKISDIENHMLLGSLQQLKSGEFGIVMGRLLANQLGLAIGDKVTVTSPDIQITPAGVYPRNKRFVLIGVFEVGAQVDQTLAFIHLDDAQKFYRTKGAQGLHVKVSDLYVAPKVMQKIAQTLGENFHVKDWSQTQGNLFQSVKMEKIVTGAMLNILIFIAVFNIISSLVLMVADKRSDIAVLRTLGLTAKQIMAIFIVQGTSVGVFGTFIGCVLGCVLALSINPVMYFMDSVFGLHIFDPDVYFISGLPSELHLSDVSVICLIALVLSFLATLYPAYRASKIEPAEALRYE